MYILVLGGTGAIGVPVVQILSEKGHFVHVTTRKMKSSNNKHIRFIEGDAHNSEFIDSILSIRHYDAILDFLVYTSTEFEKCCCKYLSNTKQYLFVSSARIYADTIDKPISEESPRLVDISSDARYLQTDDYSLEKAREEDFLRRIGNSNYTIIRPYITYNQDRLQLGVFEKEIWLQRALNGKKIVFSKDIAYKFTTLTYGYDVAIRIAELVGNPNALKSEFLITTSEKIKWIDVLNIYLNTLEKHGIKTDVIMLEHCDARTEIHNHYQVYYDRIYNRTFDNSKIEDLLGLEQKYIKAQDGLQLCLEHFLESDRKFKNIGWRFEAVLDRITGDKTKISNIPGWKNKLKYFLCRYIIKSELKIFK